MIPDLLKRTKSYACDTFYLKLKLSLKLFQIFTFKVYHNFEENDNFLQKSQFLIKGGGMIEHQIYFNANIL